MTPSAPNLRILLSLFALFAATAAWLAWAGLPVARGDDAFYKAPGAELAATGRFASPSVTGYLPKIEEVYAAYPPLYSWAFAGWVTLFGFSLLTATAFNHAIHLLGTAALVWAAAGLIRPLQLSSSLKTIVLAALAVVHFGNLRFFDRQEELALIFIWLEIGVWLAGSASGAFTGLCVGLAILVGPWPGMLAAGSVGLRMILEAAADRRVPWLQWLTTVIVAALPLGLCLAWVEWNHPGLAAQQFREHVGRVPKVFAWEHPEVWARSWTYTPYQLPFVLLGVMLLPRAFGRPWTRGTLAAFATTVVSLVAILAGGAWRADSYVYLWAALLLLFPYFAFAVGTALEKATSVGDRRMLLVMMGAATVVSLRDPVTLSINAAQFSPADRPQVVFNELHERIPPTDVVATTPRFWHAFQNRNPWRQTASLPWITNDERLRWQWIVLPLGHGDEVFRKRLLDGFELVEKRSFAATPTAPTFAPDERDWAYELYRRK
jgi:hypothetical protein